LAKELDKLLVEYKDDSCAVLLYTKALHLFKKGGPNPAADKALLEAFEQNPYVPLALSDIVEMAESNGYVGVGDETEAVSYAEDHGYLWYDTEGSINWFASVVEAKMFEHFEDKEMVQDVLKELRSL
jgi:hypothetical protein